MRDIEPLDWGIRLESGLQRLDIYSLLQTLTLLKNKTNIQLSSTTKIFREDTQLTTLQRLTNFKRLDELSLYRIEIERGSSVGLSLKGGDNPYSEFGETLNFWGGKIGL